jgi:dTDP-4-dehydrorhamnose reductase
MRIFGTGLAGLVGSRVVELLKDKYEFEASGVDITDRKAIIEKIKNSDASIVLHLAAKTDVDGCEKDKALGENGDAWKINVEGTRNIADACKESSKKLIYISTDFVFDGEKTSGYTEEDIPNPINWYSQTKYEGEKIVQKASTPWIIVRLAYPYRSHFEKKDFVRTLIDKLEKGESLQMVTDHIMTPTFIDDAAYALDTLIRKNSTGIFHVVGSEFISPYEAAFKIAKAFNFSQINIGKTTRLKFFRNRAQRPFHLAIKNDKIQRLGVKMRTFEDGLEEVKAQLENSYRKLESSNGK